MRETEGGMGKEERERAERKSRKTQTQQIEKLVCVEGGGDLCCSVLKKICFKKKQSVLKIKSFSVFLQDLKIRTQNLDTL